MTSPLSKTADIYVRGVRPDPHQIYTVHVQDGHLTHQRISYLLLAATLAAGFATVSLMMSGGFGDMAQGPTWDPAGNVPFRTWVREVSSWLNVTSTRLNPTAQAAALQRGLRGIARGFAMSIPPAAISFGANINGVMTDPVTYLLFTVGNRFEALEDERSLQALSLIHIS